MSIIIGLLVAAASFFIGIALYDTHERLAVALEITCFISLVIVIMLVGSIIFGG